VPPVDDGQGRARWLINRACLVLACQLAITPAAAAEVCRYAGSGDYHAQIGITTIAQKREQATRVRVLWDLAARVLLVFHIHYLVEEISDWRAGVLQTVALNVRFFVNGRIIRQQWDVFDRTASGFAAWRLQAKTATEFAARAGGFAPHWVPSSFGAPWLDAFRAAPAERRPDLDLPSDEAPADLVSPLAEAFYNVRSAPARAQLVALFLPGNKKQHRADIAVAAPDLGPAGAHVWRVRLDSARLGIVPGSAASLTVSADGALQTISFAVATARHAARGGIHAEGCAGSAAR